MSFKFETHAHTSEVSYCSQVTATETVRLFKQHHYDGIIITNHYYDGWFIDSHEMVKDCKNMRDRVERWLLGYRMAKEEGDRTGVKVYLGAELQLTAMGINHYLLLGGDEDFYLDNPCLYALDLRQIYALAKEKGFYFGQVHPCRDGCYPADTALLDGMEVFNGHPSANNHCDTTYDIIEKSGLITTVGGDFHEKPCVNRAAVLLERIPENAYDFAQMLLNNQIEGYLINAQFKNDPRLPFAGDRRFAEI